MNNRKADKLFALAMSLQKFLDKKPIQYVSILAFVGNRPGIPFQNLVVLTDLSKSTVARIVNWYVQEGIMEASEIPENRREKAAYLTPKGRRIIEEIWSKLG